MGPISKPVIAQLAVFTLILANVATGHIHSQQNTEKEAVRLKADLVQIDAVVIDKNHRPVTNLTREDFELTEDGRPQPLAFSSLVETARNGSDAARPDVIAGDQPPYADEQEGGRQVFLIIDPYFISFENHLRLKRALQRFVDESLGPQDHFTFVNLGGGIAAFRRATRDREIIKLAIDQMLGDGKKLSEQGLAGRGLSEKDARVSQDYRLRNTLRSLASLAERLKETPGRKIAIFVSELLPLWKDEVECHKGLCGLTRTLNYASELRQIIGASRRSGLVFYTVDPQGLTASTAARQAAGPAPRTTGNGKEVPEENAARLNSPVDSRRGLSQLAEATGGFAIFDTNDPNAALGLAMAENESYYALGYYPSEPALDGRFRLVKVRVRNRPDLEVRARIGYLARSQKDDGRSFQGESGMNRAVAHLGPLRRVMVGLTVDGPSLDRRAPRARLHIRPRPEFFYESGGKRLGTFEIKGYVFDLKDNLIDGFSQTLNLALTPSNYARATGSGIDLPVDLPIKKPGLYNIRVAVRERGGEVGTVSEWAQIK
ncbi:MAG TPA: VWA domain-containing protein [Blastocatellia bacterium]|nr:VWA domain-containing protein [Blastocatellia bacterium]